MSRVSRIAIHFYDDKPAGVTVIVETEATLIGHQHWQGGRQLTLDARGKMTVEDGLELARKAVEEIRKGMTDG